jgi:hypothetical protein
VTAREGRCGGALADQVCDRFRTRFGLGRLGDVAARDDEGRVIEQQREPCCDQRRQIARADVTRRDHDCAVRKAAVQLVDQLVLTLP